MKLDQAGGGEQCVELLATGHQQKVSEFKASRLSIATLSRGVKTSGMAG